MNQEPIDETWWNAEIERLNEEEQKLREKAEELDRCYPTPMPYLPEHQIVQVPRPEESP